MDQPVFTFGYGAICVPDVQNLIVRDNSITNFGSTPGADVCGIFILHGEMVEISRNHVVETRDWGKASTDTQGAANRLRGGIWAALVTPPAFSTASAAIADTIYEPGLPALRVQENTVRVPLAESLAAIGFGPFEISNNHFGCGGAIRAAGFQMAQTVLILNLGVALEVANAVRTPSGLFKNTQATFSTLNQPTLFSPSSGTVLFTNNVCQLEARGGGNAPSHQ